MTTARDLALEAQATQLIHRNTELRERLDATLDAFNRERVARERADKVAKAVTAQRKAATAWQRDDTVVTRQALNAATKATEAALAAWAEFEVDPS